MSQKEKENSNLDDNYLYAASATEMTGLARTIAHNEYEAQSYEEVFPYLPPVSPNPDGKAVASVADGIHAEYRTHVRKQLPPDSDIK